MHRNTVAVLTLLVTTAMTTAACGESTPAPVMPTTDSAKEPAPVAPPPAPTAEAPKPPEKTLAQKMEETTKTLVDAWNGHDAAKIASAYTENASFTLVGMPPMSGRAAIQAQAADALKAFPDFKVALTRINTKGNVAFVEWVITGTNTGDSEMMKIKATKRPMGLHGVDVAVYDEASGLIKETRRYSDMGTQMSQLDPKAKAGTFRAVAPLPTAAPTMAAWKEDPATAKNLEIVNAMYKSIDDHKLDAMTPMVAPDIVIEDYTDAAPKKGVKATKEYLQAVIKAIPDLKQDLTQQIAVGDLVITEGKLHGTQKGALGPLKATNKPVEMHFVDIMQVKDGKLVAGWTYANGLELMPPPPAAKM